jgi:hypothetical protein
VVRLTPTAATTIDALLAMPIGLDVWERRGEVVVAVVSEGQLSELRRRRLVIIERLSRVEDLKHDAPQDAPHERD